uniref:SDR family NAD(P)-dependent oxidoreductase n=1 Tax=Arthrobacter sp. TaxID=1667 RepID=UPI000EB6D945|nr:SDR family oxidoreductase [Arthrobacter sp.]AXV46636.1 3-ketoacyl-(acyl-carrier-protein) reductase, dehydrogenase [Arthrobacter sp.]
MSFKKPSSTPVVVVTGGGRGIGAAYCLDLAAAGFDVVVADILDEGSEVAEKVRATGREAMFVKVDVTVEESTRALAAAVQERFGRVDALVNNAALYQALGNKRPFTHIAEDEWDKVMAVNVKGPWQVAKSIYPLMLQAGYGRIVNVASSTVHMGAPGFPHYVASKGAVIALTRSLAREVGAEGVTVNCVAPGLVHNDSSVALNGDEGYFAASAQQRAIPRSMEEQDLFGAVRFLTSEASRFITGQTVIVDGGQAFS